MITEARVEWLAMEMAREGLCGGGHAIRLFDSGRLYDFLEASALPDFFAEQRNAFRQRLGLPALEAEQAKVQPSLMVTASLVVIRNTWKRIKLGTPGLKCGPDFIRALEQAGHKINGWARDTLNQPAFTVAPEEAEIDLIVVSVADLGFTKIARYDEICAEAQHRGLELCSTEIAPQLRLQYTDQPLNERLHIAMEPIRGSDSDLDVLSVEHHDGGLCLYGNYGAPDFLWYPDARFVFRLRKVSVAT